MIRMLMAEGGATSPGGIELLIASGEDLLLAAHDHELPSGTA